MTSDMVASILDWAKEQKNSVASTFQDRKEEAW